jgi:hypothetical protein
LFSPLQITLDSALNDPMVTKAAADKALCH